MCCLCAKCLIQMWLKSPQTEDLREEEKKNWPQGEFLRLRTCEAARSDWTIPRCGCSIWCRPWRCLMYTHKGFVVFIVSFPPTLMCVRPGPQCGCRKGNTRAAGISTYTHARPFSAHRKVPLFVSAVNATIKFLHWEALKKHMSAEIHQTFRGFTTVSPVFDWSCHSWDLLLIYAPLIGFF